MPRRPDHALGAALAGCEGVFTLKGLCELGQSRFAVEALMRNPTRSRRLLPGVYVAHSGTPTERELDLASIHYAGPKALLTGARALSLLGVREVPRGRERVVLLPTPGERASREFVTVLETTRAPEAVLRDGIPVAPPARAALDLARSTRDERLVQVVFSELIRDRHVVVSDLVTELLEGPRWGSALPRRVLAGLNAGARSKPELDAWRLFCESPHLPAFTANAHLYDAESEWIACADFYTRGLVVEIQSAAHHFHLAAWESDEARMARLASYGLLVLRVVPSRLYRDWPKVEAELTAAAAAAAGNTIRVHVGAPPPWWGERQG